MGTTINERIAQTAEELEDMTEEELQLTLSGTRVHLRSMLVFMRAADMSADDIAEGNQDGKCARKINCPRHFAELSLEQSLMVAIEVIRRYQEMKEAPD